MVSVGRLGGTVGPQPTRLIMFDIAKLTTSADSPSLSLLRLIFADCIPSRLSVVPPSCTDNNGRSRGDPRGDKPTAFHINREQGSDRVIYIVIKKLINDR